MGVEGFNLPLCIIPLEIWKNYKERVKTFYDNNGKLKVEDQIVGIERGFKVEFKKLFWDEILGLTNISFSGGGLDLDHRKYSFHNIFPESCYGKAAFAVAEKYIELLNEK